MPSRNSRRDFLERATLLAAIVLSSAAPLTAQETPEHLLARAIDSAGGAARLAAARAFEWQATAVVHVPGRDIHIRGSWRVQPPDSAVVATYITADGPSSMRRVILAGRRGWLQGNGTTTVMTNAVLTEERHQFYLYSLLRLVPLRDAGVTLLAASSDSAGHPGIVVRRPGHPEVTLFFGANARVVGLRTIFAISATAGTEAQVIALDGTMTASDIRWFQRMTITRDGHPYYEMTLTSLQAMARLDDPLLAGPGADQ